MGITFALIGMFACLLVIVAVRLGLHELCYRFDGEKPSPPGGWSINPYWLTFKSTHDVSFEQDKEAFHDRQANFPTLELAMHGSILVNADRKAKGQPLYTVVHSSDGMEWQLENTTTDGGNDGTESEAAS